jgi:hypothetical protein
MLEDANYFSWLGEDIHLDPLLKDYLASACQAYIYNPPAAEPLGDLRTSLEDNQNNAK